MSLSYMYGFPSLRMSEAERLRQEERYRPHSRIFRLPNLGGQFYQQRHNKLIAYTAQAYHGEHQDYGRRVTFQEGFIDFLNVVNLREGSRSGKSQMALELDRKYGRGKSTVIMPGDFVDGSAFKTVSVPVEHVDYFSAWTGDRHFGLEPGRSSDAVLSSKHNPPPPVKYPKANIGRIMDRQPMGDAFLQALGYHVRAAATPYPQLHLSDLGDIERPLEEKMFEMNLERMRVIGQRIRGGGKSMSLGQMGFESASAMQWYGTVLRFKLMPHQEAVMGEVKKNKRGIYAAY